MDNPWEPNSDRCGGPLLSAYLDGETTEEERAAVESHVASCTLCSSSLDRMRELDDRLRAVLPPADLHDRVMRRVGLDQAPVRQRPAVRYAMAAALLAVFGAGVLAGIRWRDPERVRLVRNEDAPVPRAATGAVPQDDAQAVPPTSFDRGAVYPETELPLHVMSDVKTGDPIVLNSSTGEWAVYTPGQSIVPGVTALHIEHNRVIIENRGVIQQITPAKDDPRDPYIPPPEEKTFEWADAVRNAQPVPLELELPPPYFGGAPLAYSSEHLEAPSASPRPQQMVPAGTRLLSRGRPVTSSDPTRTAAELALVTDGDKRHDRFVELAAGPQWVQVDLGEECAVIAIVVWHYFAGERVYFDVAVAVSPAEDFSAGVEQVFSNDYDASTLAIAGEDKEYVESYEGKLLRRNCWPVRTVRCFSNGNSTDQFNHYIEVEVWGMARSDFAADQPASSPPTSP